MRVGIIYLNTENKKAIRALCGMAIKIDSEVVRVSVKKLLDLID